MERERNSAYWEFSRRFTTPTVQRLIRKPSGAHAVEFGYGDGRLLRPAASYFGRVTGVAIDESDDRDSANTLLEASRGASISLVQQEAENTLPLDRESADFIYSRFGTFRLPDLRAFELLALETARVLKPGGVATFWFGRMSRLPFAPPGKDWLRGWTLRPPEGDLARQVLHIRTYHSRRAMLRAGMKAVSMSTPLHPDTSWRLLRGGPLSFITAWKPIT